MAALPAFAGTVSPADLLTKLDAQGAELEARRAAADARLSLLERVGRAAGVAIGAVPMAYLRTTALTPAALANRSTGLLGGFLDYDGKVAVVRLTDTRFAVVTQEGFVQGAAAVLRASVIDVAAGGAQAQVSTAAFLANNTGYNLNFVAVLGAYRLSDHAFRMLMSCKPGPDVSYSVLVTVSIDPISGSISTTTDLSNVRSSAPAALYTTGSTHRRRAYPVGQAGILFPRVQGVQHVDGASLSAPGGYLVERTTGSTAVLARVLAGYGYAYSHAYDRMAENLLLTLADGYGYTPGTPTGAILSLAYVDDISAGAVAALRIPNALAGNARVTALSGTLAVFGYTTGAQYASYLAVRDPVTNGLRLAGASSTLGALGQAPVEILSVGPTRFIALTKSSASWTLTATLYECDPNAPAGASPFAQIGQPFSVILGVGIANAAPGDTVVVAAVEQVTADRLVVAYRNTTRNVTGVDIVDIG